MYTFTVDMFSSILSFTACVTFQAFLGSQTQKTLLGGLGIQFLFMEELSIIHFAVIRIVTNLAHTSLNSFYSGHLEIANYVLNNRPIGCCVCASLLTMSGARLVLIASPGFYQGINQKLYLRLSAMFITSVVVSDFLINHIRCLLIHSNNYETPTVSFMREEISITFQMPNHSLSNTTSSVEFQRQPSYFMPTDSECTEIKIIGAMIFLSALLEGIKIVIYFVRIFRKAKKTAPTPKKQSDKKSRPNQQKITNLKRSNSSGQILTLPNSHKSLTNKFSKVFRNEDLHAGSSSTRLPALPNLEMVGIKERERAHLPAYHTGTEMGTVKPSESQNSQALGNNERQHTLSMVSDESLAWKSLRAGEDEKNLVASKHPFLVDESESSSPIQRQSLIKQSDIQKNKVKKCITPLKPKLNVVKPLDSHEWATFLYGMSSIPKFTKLQDSETSIDWNQSMVLPTNQWQDELQNSLTKVRRRHSLPPSKLFNSRDEKDSKPLKPHFEVQWKKLVYKPMKDFLLRSSTVTFVMSLFGIMVLVKILMRYDKDSSDSSIRLLSSVVRIYTLALPVLLVLFDDQVLSYALSFFL